MVRARESNELEKFEKTRKTEGQGKTNKNEDR